MTRKDFQELAGVRLAEARILFRSGSYSGAYYLAGYAVECALKACIARSVRRYDFPPREARDYYTHSLKDLLKHAAIEDPGSKHSTLPIELRTNWRFVEQWNEQSRYEIKSQGDAQSILDAIGDRTHGVLPWLKKYW